MTPAEASAAITADTEAGVVDTATGEVIEPAPSTEEATKTVEDILGGTVIDVTDEAAAPEPTPAPAEAKPNPAAGHKCENCGKALENEDQNLVRLAWIKERRKLCNEDFQKVRN